ncbi:MAG TPA: Asp-tRNA(Asn)/Glu-tRNA(Gln) amidotransferase subunit GatC [Burkholderiales bacterium]
MSLTPDDVRRLARLARIAIEPQESAAVLERLNRVLALVDQMRAVDTRGIEPMAHPAEAQFPNGQRLREDEVREKDQRALYQSVAPAGPDGKPQVQDGLYLVPKVIE